MIKWHSYNEHDEYEATLQVECDEELDTIKLTLKPSTNRIHWLLSAESGEYADFRVKSLITTTPQYDIDDVKRLAEQTLSRDLAKYSDMIYHLQRELNADMARPMPNRLQLAKSVWAEYKTVPKITTEDGILCINANWRSFSSGCSDSYIRQWFMKTFGFDIEELED